MSQPRLALLALACGVVGGLVTILWDTPYGLFLGLALMLAWILLGAWVIASPEYLGHDDDAED